MDGVLVWVALELWSLGKYPENVTCVKGLSLICEGEQLVSSNSLHAVF
jgi:hypothetical protein